MNLKTRRAAGIDPSLTAEEARSAYLKSLGIDPSDGEANSSGPSAAASVGQTPAAGTPASPRSNAASPRPGTTGDAELDDLLDELDAVTPTSRTPPSEFAVMKTLESWGRALPAVGSGGTSSPAPQSARSMPSKQPSMQHVDAAAPVTPSDRPLNGSRSRSDSNDSAPTAAAVVSLPIPNAELQPESPPMRPATAVPHQLAASDSNPKLPVSPFLGSDNSDPNDSISEFLPSVRAALAGRADGGAPQRLASFRRHSAATPLSDFSSEVPNDSISEFLPSARAAVAPRARPQGGDASAINDVPNDSIAEFLPGQ